MVKFFVGRTIEKEDVIEGDVFKHIALSLRAKIGDEIAFLDGNNHEFVAKITEISKKSLSVKLIETIALNTELKRKIHLYNALPKSDRMDYVLQKCTELGVSSFHPMITERTIKKCADFANKFERYKKIIISACEQSNRGIVPTLFDVIDFETAVKNASGLKLFCYEKKCDFIYDTIKNIDSDVSIFIGPEGGFTDDEASLALECGLKAVSFGSRILRTDTAPLYAASVVGMMMDRKI